MLVRQMALDWGPDGVRCNCVSPGSIHTPASAASYDDPVRRQQREQEIPLRRLGKADDIANAVAFLLSEQASYITGTNLLVDGGLGQTLLVSAMSATQG
jgi:NAD(P)-dependent dehydrogenase (short-subunit alcohol dehydrogenase family)